MDMDYQNQRSNSIQMKPSCRLNVDRRVLTAVSGLPLLAFQRSNSVSPCTLRAHALTIRCAYPNPKRPILGSTYGVGSSYYTITFGNSS